MRVSMLGFGRFYDEHGRMAVLLNKGKLEHLGIRMLSPVGGGLAYKPDGYQELVAMGAHRFEGRPGENELRFVIPNEQIEPVVSWFTDQRNREQTSLREVYEELGRKHGEPSGFLDDADFKDVTDTYAFSTHFEGETTRILPEEDKLTLYLIENYDVHWPPHVMRKLIAASQLPIDKRWLYFVDGHEIKAGITNEGITIGQITACML